MLDRQAPDVKVVADRNNHIDLLLLVTAVTLAFVKVTYHETSIDTDRRPKHTEHIRDLVSAIT